MLIAGKNNGPSNDAPSSSNLPQSHQILCCAYNANGTVFVTGSSDTFARVCMLSDVVSILDHVVFLPIRFGLFVSVNIIWLVDFLYGELGICRFGVLWNLMQMNQNNQYMRWMYWLAMRMMSIMCNSGQSVLLNKIFLLANFMTSVLFYLQWVCCGFKIFIVWLFEGWEYSKVQEFLVSSSSFHVLSKQIYLLYSQPVSWILLFSGFVMTTLLPALVMGVQLFGVQCHVDHVWAFKAFAFVDSNMMLYVHIIVIFLMVVSPFVTFCNRLGESWTLETCISSEGSASSTASSTSKRRSAPEISSYPTWCKYDCVEPG